VVLRFISKEKCYSKVSELVRMSLRFHVKMGRSFYQRAAAELEQWGQDPDSVRLAAILTEGGGGNGGREEEREGSKVEVKAAVTEPAPEWKSSVVQTCVRCEGEDKIQLVEMDIGSPIEQCLEDTPTAHTESWARIDSNG